MRNTLIPRFTLLALVLVLAAAACAKRQTPVATPQPPPSNAPSTATTAPLTPPAVQRLPEQLPVPPQPALSEDAVGSKTLDDLNRNSPLKPVFFTVDSADLDEAGRQVASANADILKTNTRWVVTIEGHCDERGTAEYNLALGERRAIAVKTFLVSLGISPERIRTISYGKEFPFDPGKTDDAMSKNRRGHFVITSN
jgi:peptidoglycan-associated lipoprotein